MFSIKALFTYRLAGLQVPTSDLKSLQNHTKLGVLVRINGTQTCRAFFQDLESRAELQQFCPQFKNRLMWILNAMNVTTIICAVSMYSIYCKLFANSATKSECYFSTPFKLYSFGHSSQKVKDGYNWKYRSLQTISSSVLIHTIIPVS